MLNKIRPNVLILGAGVLAATVIMNFIYGVDGMKEVNLVVFGGLIGTLSTIAADPPPPTVPEAVATRMIDRNTELMMAQMGVSRS